MNPEHESNIRGWGPCTYVATRPTSRMRKAGIDRAVGLVAAADTDAENLVVVLTARATAPNLRIVSRVNEAAWLQRIKNAGADVAQSPYESYGRLLADSAGPADVPPVM